MSKARSAALEMQGVSKFFGAHCAVAQLSLSVPRGGIYGFIGPNGSGKTSTLRMAMNLILPDQGLIKVFGSSSLEASRNFIGYLPEERGLYKSMSVRRLLRYFGRLKGAQGQALEASISGWIERMGLGAWADEKIEALSKGMAQKVQFMAAVVSQPELLILDEPFTGLDPVNAHEMKQAIREIKARGVSVILSTHDMAAAEGLCDRIGMLHQGRKVLDGSLKDIQAAYPGDRVRLRCDKSCRYLLRLPGVLSARRQGAFQMLDLATTPQALLKALARRAQVSHFEVLKPSLSDIFLKIAQPSPKPHARL